MERTTQFRKSFKSGMLLGLLTMVCPFVQAQLPTVTVSNNCEVVVAGTGGTLGFGGTVGSGGIVVMPDPGDGDFTINNNGNTPINWRMLGDISFTPPGPPNTIKQNEPVTSLTETIYSFNKDVRPSETANSTLARSIGRVRISYERELCNSYIEFHIYKRYDASVVPPIVGESCWLPETTYTYSVDQIASDNLNDAIGVDEYYWTVYKDNVAYPIDVLYYSADKSAITFTTPSDISGDWYIECCYGKANAISWGGTSTTCVTKIIGLEPEMPELNIPECVAIGQTNFTISVINAVSGYTYKWSSSNSVWTFNDATGTSTTVSGLGGGSGTIILTIENPACGQTTEFEYPVGRSFISPYVYIEEQESCLTPEGAYTFSIMPTGVQANQTYWSVNGLPIESTDWEIDESIGSNTNGTHSVVDIIVPGSATPGAYTLSAYSCSDATTVTIEVTVRPKNPEIDEPTQANYCINSGNVTPIVFTVEPAGAYQWTIPDGWSSNNSTTETIILTPNGLNAGEVKAFAVGVNVDCSSEEPAVWEVNFNPIEPAGIEPVSCWNIGYDAQNTVIVSNAPSPFFGTYVITESSGDLLDEDEPYSVGSNGDIILNTLGTALAGTYYLDIVHETDCGSSQVKTVSIIFGGNGTQVQRIPLGAADLYYVITPPSSNPEIVFRLFDSNGEEYYSQQENSGSFTLNGPGQVPTRVCADVTIDGCTTRSCVTGGTYGPNQKIANPGTVLENTGIKVYPNPNKGTFSIDLESVVKSANVQIYDVQGKLISNHTLKKGENTLKESVPTGMYMLLINVDGKISTYKIQVNN